jgi:hypothetical protein
MGIAKIYEDFENGVGTYLKVVRFPEPPNPDGFIVLYLRSTGLFLFLGYWRGYERSAVAGRWSRHDDAVSLDGCGETSTDAPPRQAGKFQRTLKADVQNHTPVLVGASEFTGWSLLGWTGPFIYIGRATVINPDGEWLPRSCDEVDAWIERLMAQ